MPRKEINYLNTIIYKFVCNDLNIKDTYVGHTTDFIKRKATHKSVCHNLDHKSYNLKVYKMIRTNGNWDNWSMIEIEKYPCNDKNEACARERYWYELLNANMNTLCPTFNVEKRKDNEKAYYVANKEDIIKKVHEYAATHKEEISRRSKNYRENHKEQIKARKSKVCICEICNREYTHDHKARHERTKVHLNQITKT